MNMNKFLEFFNPADVKQPIHIIGCGAMGSTLAIMLTRMGLTNFTLYDMDIVSSHNIANQQFTHPMIGRAKPVALREMMININPTTKVHLELEGYSNQELEGYVFLCLDSIELRHKIVKANIYNQRIKLIMDLRMELYSGQHYAANWDIVMQRNNLLKSMNFTDEEARKNTPVSACNLTLSVMPTVQSIVSFAVANFINFIKSPDSLKLMMVVNPFEFNIAD